MYRQNRFSGLSGLYGPKIPVKSKGKSKNRSMAGFLYGRKTSTYSTVIDKNFNKLTKTKHTDGESRPFYASNG